MKRVTKMLLVLGIALGLAKVTNAATTEQLTVTITPNAFYSLLIDTDTVGLDLGTVALAASTQTASASTVTINSTFASTDIRLDGAITSGGTPWTFDADTTSNEQDALQAWATFTTTSRSSAPAQGGAYFQGTAPGAVGSDVIDENNLYVGTNASGPNTDLFEASGDFDAIDMDGRAVSSEAHLWLYFTLPSASTSSNAQNITITLTAVAPN